MHANESVSFVLGDMGEGKKKCMVSNLLHKDLQLLKE